jgi:hypothetical protein
MKMRDSKLYTDNTEFNMLCEKDENGKLVFVADSDNNWILLIRDVNGNIIKTLTSTDEER